MAAFKPCTPGVGAAGAVGVRAGPVLDILFLPPEEGEVVGAAPPRCPAEAEGSNTLSRVTGAAPAAAALEAAAEPPTQEELPHPPPPTVPL